MNYYINNDKTVAIANDHYLQPMDTCPRGVKVQLLTTGGVLVYGTWNGRDKGYTSWYPLPKQPKPAVLKVTHETVDPDIGVLLLQAERV